MPTLRLAVSNPQNRERSCFGTFFAAMVCRDGRHDASPIPMATRAPSSGPIPMAAASGVAAWWCGSEIGSGDEGWSLQNGFNWKS